MAPQQNGSAVELSTILQCGENAGLIHFLQERAERLATFPRTQAQPPGDVDGVHPDIVIRLWNELASVLPEKCQWVLLGTPILVRLDTAVVFAFGVGMSYCLRLPPHFYAEAIQADYESTRGDLNLNEIGTGCLFGKFLDLERQWCLAAHESASI